MRIETRHFSNISLQKAAKNFREDVKPTIIDMIITVIGQPPGMSQIIYSTQEDGSLLGIQFDERDPVRDKILEYCEDVDTMSWEAMEQSYHNMMYDLEKNEKYEALVNQAYSEPDDDVL